VNDWLSYDVGLVRFKIAVHGVEEKFSYKNVTQQTQRAHFLHFLRPYIRPVYTGDRYTHYTLPVYTGRTYG